MYTILSSNLGPSKTTYKHFAQAAAVARYWSETDGKRVGTLTLRPLQSHSFECEEEVIFYGICKHERGQDA